MSVPVLSPWLARNGPKEWCCCRRGPTCLGPLSLTGPMGMSGRVPSLSCYVGVALCSGWSRSPAPDSPWCFSKNSLFCFLSSSCGPAAAVTPLAGLGGGLLGHLAPFIGYCPETPLGSPPFFPPESWLSLPSSSRSGTVGPHRARVSAPPPAYTQMVTHPTSQREGPGGPQHLLLTRGTLGPSSLDGA